MASQLVAASTCSSGRGDVNVEIGNATGDARDVVTEISNNTLTIRKDRAAFGLLSWFGFGTDGYEVHVTLPELVYLSASGGSDVEGESTFSKDNLEIHASSGSDLSLDVEVERLVVSVPGGSDVALEGTADHVTVQTSGGSDLHAAELTTKVADVSARGGSDISIDVVERLTADASGGSDVDYSGKPRDTDIDVSGGSDVGPR